MNELELFPSEEQINMMNKEYSELERRRNLCENCPPANERPNQIAPPHHSVCLCKSKKCGSDPKQKKLFERIYFAEQDLIMALRQLYTTAPVCVKDDISDLIKLKNQTSNLALKCYYSVTDNQIINYAPTMCHEEDYCRLLKHIITLQKQLLLMLNKAKFLCAHSKKMIQNEWTASYILTSIGMYCRF